MEYEMSANDLSARHPYQPLSGGTNDELAHATGQSRTGSETAKPWDRGSQTRALLLKGTFRWIITLIFTGLILLTLKIYERKGNFPSGQKKTLDAILTGLILLWGLNLFVSDDPTRAGITLQAVHRTLAENTTGSV